jgi:hypothetical protein
MRSRSASTPATARRGSATPRASPSLRAPEPDAGGAAAGAWPSAARRTGTLLDSLGAAAASERVSQVVPEASRLLGAAAVRLFALGDEAREREARA